MSSKLLELDVSQLQNISLADPPENLPSKRPGGSILSRFIKRGGCRGGRGGGSLLQEDGCDDEGSSSRYIPPPWTSPSLARRLTQKIVTSPLLNRRGKERETPNFVTIQVVHDSGSALSIWDKHKKDSW